MPRPLILVLAAAALAAGCGGGSSGGAVSKRTPPDLAAFLRLPVATPSACPSANSTTSGRRSPWAGHVDVSVYLTDHADARTIRSLRDSLQRLSGIRTVYYESKDQAYAEFQRLYTCSANYPRGTVPASYRLILNPLTHTNRDAVVRRIRSLPGVAAVSCDPSDPCTSAAGTG